MKLSIALISCLLCVTGCTTTSEKVADSMQQEEQAIQRWFDEWIKATTEGDLELARRLIADDAVFLVPGAGEMDKESFAAAATASAPDTDFELDCEIEEIKIIGDHAWLRTRLGLTIIDKQSGSQTTMAGHALSVLQRRGDGWVVIRDANTMVPVTQD